MLYDACKATDTSGAVKFLMDALHHELVDEEIPDRVKITASCRQINRGGQGDISISIQHTLSFSGLD